MIKKFCPRSAIRTVRTIKSNIRYTVRAALEDPHVHTLDTWTQLTSELALARYHRVERTGLTLCTVVDKVSFTATVHPFVDTRRANSSVTFN